MTTFVLVPGFWIGGWAFDAVADALQELGHAAHAVTLPGLDGADPAGVGAEDHVAAVVAAVDAATRGGGPVVLVGHSGGGPVAAPAAERRPGVLAHLVFVDTAALPDGWAQIDFHPPEGQSGIRAAIGDGATYPMPTDEELDVAGSSREGIDDATWAGVRSRAVDQPARTVTEPVRRGEREPDLPKTVVACSFPAAAVEYMSARFPEMADPEWSVRELPTGHWPMFSRPADLAALLADLPLRKG